MLVQSSRYSQTDFVKFGMCSESSCYHLNTSAQTVDEGTTLLTQNSLTSKHRLQNMAKHKCIQYTVRLTSVHTIKRIPFKPGYKVIQYVFSITNICSSLHIATTMIITIEPQVGMVPKMGWIYLSSCLWKTSHFDVC